MTDIFDGRYTAVAEEPFVLFLIGMRINKLWAIHKWLPVARAMPAMLRVLYQYPEKGFLGGRQLLEWRSATMIQYWRSFDHLEAFARNPQDPHLEPWKHFNQAVGADGSVGIWHESYLIEPNGYECVYVNMPRIGLGAVVDHVEAVGRRHQARSRLQETV